MELSFSDERIEDKKLELLKLLSKNIRLRQKKKVLDNSSDEFHRLTSDNPTLFSKFPSHHSESRDRRLYTFDYSILHDKKRTQSLNCYYTMKNELSNLATLAFERLVNAYDHSGLVRFEPEDTYIHISIIKQFLLDCYVSDLCFYNLLLAPLLKKTWADQGLFLQVLGAFQRLPLNEFYFFSQKNQDKRLLQVQKMICKIYLVFFKVIQFAFGVPMNQEKLRMVFQFSLSDAEHSQSYAELTALVLNKANATRGRLMNSITFSEFNQLLKIKKL
jgi:hypothetical protein